ncbi:HupE/UreJ family protein [Chelativorans salis]|uniref:HupE/UreJ family protein n=1 Tax=Chelativorans salis TaxID=2978478 RepID=A0ABT2LSU9_9HYPH|nr:HupE/UreJ family protein [Chelativorans sp. EGI FJ00035]MCT7377616.1 HupE/UreJ family protein [Chelativorans sp. EGI FJ00035]
MFKRLAFAAIALVAATAPALAHLNPAEHGSFMAGVSHPLFGLDHVLVMVAVGLWAATLGQRALMLVPAAFAGMMVLGFAIALLGASLPLVEPVILASVVFIGLMVALAIPMPAAGVAGVVAFFAFFHGHAHGGELGTAGALQFAIGFALATPLLHAAGIALGLAFGRWQKDVIGRALTRIAGFATALAGLWLAFAG